jgi:hypothetical protein
MTALPRRTSTRRLVTGPRTALAPEKAELRRSDDRVVADAIACGGGIAVWKALSGGEAARGGC